MGVDAAQVCMQKDICREAGIFFRTAYVEEYVVGKLPQLGIGAGNHAAKIAICRPEGPACQLQIIGE